MANGGDFEGDVTDYVFEEHRNPDGSLRKVARTLAGIIASEDIYGIKDEHIESKVFSQSDGRLIKRTVYENDVRGKLLKTTTFDGFGKVTSVTSYEWDGHRRPLKSINYDGQGNVVSVQERGKPLKVVSEHK